MCSTAERKDGVSVARSYLGEQVRVDEIVTCLAVLGRSGEIVFQVWMMGGGGEVMRIRRRVPRLK